MAMKAALFILVLASAHTAAFFLSAPAPSFVARKQLGISTTCPSAGLARKNFVRLPVPAKKQQHTAPRMMWGFLPSEDEMKEQQQPPPVIEISTEDELESVLTRAKFVGKVVVVDWYASWCRVCFFLEVQLSNLCLLAVASSSLVLCFH